MEYLLLFLALALVLAALALAFQLLRILPRTAPDTAKPATVSIHPAVGVSIPEVDEGVGEGISVSSLAAPTEELRELSCHPSYHSIMTAQEAVAKLRSHVWELLPHKIQQALVHLQALSDKARP